MSITNGTVQSSTNEWGDPTSSSYGCWFSTDGDTLRVVNQRTPASSSAAGFYGEICFDSNYMYYCVAGDGVIGEWVRTAWSTF